MLLTSAGVGKDKSHICLESSRSAQMNGPAVFFFFFVRVYCSAWATRESKASGPDTLHSWRQQLKTKALLAKFDIIYMERGKELIENKKNKKTTTDEESIKVKLFPLHYLTADSDVLLNRYNMPLVT